MECQSYIAQNQMIHDNLIQFINDASNTDTTFQELLHSIDHLQLKEHSNELKLLLRLISKLSNYHHRYPSFIEKIKKLIMHLKNIIKQSLTNLEIFFLFLNNKLILLFLIEEKIITVNESITKYILTKSKHKFHSCHVYGELQLQRNKIRKYFSVKNATKNNYKEFFFPEIEKFISDKKRLKIEKELNCRDENFELNRRQGENEEYICQLIRQDSFDEFISHVSKNDISLSSEVKQSIFETNPLLMKKQATLIEYSAFFGSIQIFKYLITNNVELNPSLWLYAIHGNNSEIIHILEDKNIKIQPDSYFEVLEESIKCHHNEIANYIINNYSDIKIDINDDFTIENLTAFGFKYLNFEFIDKEFNNFQFILYYACLYGYLTIVQHLIKTEKVNLNIKVILQIIFFSNKIDLLILHPILFNHV